MEKMYTLEAFAALCGVTPALAAAYQGQGWLAGQAGPDGETLYPIFQFYPFSFPLYLEGLGLSRQAVADYLPRRSRQKLAALLADCAPVDAAAQKRLHGQLEKFQEADGAWFDQPRVVNSPARQLLLSPPVDPALPAPAQVSAAFLAGCMAAGLDIYGYSGTVCRKDALYPGKASVGSFFIACGDGPLPAGAQLFEKPAGPYLTLYQWGLMDDIWRGRQAMAAYAAAHGLQLGDYFYASYVLGGLSTQDTDAYLLALEWALA